MKSFSGKFFRRAGFLPALPLLLALAAGAQPIVFSNQPGAMRPLPRRTSIILILADGLGWGDLSCQGQQKFQTPNLDKLSAEGVRFTDYSAGGAPTNSPGARAALLSGRAAAAVPLAPDAVTVAQILKNAGYHTGYIGDWNLGDENSSGAPWKKGFDEFAGYLNATDADNFYADYLFRYMPHTQMNPTDHQPQTSEFIGREMLYYNTGGRRGTYIPDLFTKAAVNFVKDNQPDRFNHFRPFFLALNYPIPGGGNGQVPTDAPYDDESWPQQDKHRAALIARLDDAVGQLRQQLDKSGMSNNVVIFFTSDTPARKGNGADPEFFHSNVSTNDWRVPMIVHWPGRIPAGQVSDFKWSAEDFLPTAAEISFAEMPAGIDGKSALPAMAGK